MPAAWLGVRRAFIYQVQHGTNARQLFRASSFRLASGALMSLWLQSELYLRDAI